MADATPVHDLFLSYRRADAARLEPLLAALQALGLRIWRDTREMEDFSNVQQAIDAGLGRSRALLVWYSAHYNESRACQWELSAGYLAAQADPATGGDPRRRILVINPEPGNAHIHLPELFSQQWLAALPVGDENAVQALAHRIHAALQAVPATPLGSLKALTPPRWFPHMGTGSTRFVGRLATMWQIHGHLQAGEAAMLTGAGGRPALTQVRGAGGIGKSLMAEEYALRYGAAYPGGIFWLRAYGYTDSERVPSHDERRSQRESQLADFAARLGLLLQGLSPAEVAGQLGHHLGRTGLPFLWVVDDLPADLGDEGLAPWLAPHALGRSLVTTRARRFNHVQAIELPMLDAADAVRLLTRGRALSDDDTRIAGEICRALGHHALAVDVAAALVERRGLATFQQNLQRDDKDALELAATGFAEALPNGHERSIASTLLASLRELDEASLDVLRLATHLAAAPIPRELIWRSLAQIDTLSDDEAQDRCDPALDHVLASSLADPADDGGITVHTLISRTLQCRERQAERRIQFREPVLMVLLATLPRVTDIRQHAALTDWMPHARSVAADPRDVPTAQLLGWVGRHDLERGAYGPAAQAFKTQLSTNKLLLGEEHPDTLSSMNNLASTLYNQGDLAGARELQEAVLEAVRRTLGEEHPDTLTSMNNLAETLSSQGDLAGARQLQEAVLKARRRTLGEEHPATLKSMSDRAITLGNQGDLAGARQLQEAVLEMSRRTLGEEHPHTLIWMNNLAITLRNQGDLAGARQLQEAVLKVSRRMLGEEHPHTLRSMGNLASTLQNQGDLAGARQLQVAVLEAMRRTLGEEHPDTLTSMNNLAITLAHMREWPLALPLQQRAAECLARILGPGHPNTKSVFEMLAAMQEAALQSGQSGDPTSSSNQRGLLASVRRWWSRR